MAWHSRSCKYLPEGYDVYDALTSVCFSYFGLTSLFLLCGVRDVRLFMALGECRLNPLYIEIIIFFAVTVIMLKLLVHLNG